MRNVSIQEFEERPAEFLSEVEAGSRLTLVRDSKPVVTVTPVEDLPLPDAAGREKARAELRELLKKGADLGGRPFTYDERTGR